MEKINQRKVVKAFLWKHRDLGLLFCLRYEIKYFPGEDPVGKKIENKFITQEGVIPSASVNTKEMKAMSRLLKFQDNSKLEAELTL